MHNRRKQAGPKEAVHEEAHGSIRRLAELGSQGEYGAADGRRGQSGVIHDLQARLTVKRKVRTGHAGPPHDKDDAQVVQLIAKAVHIGAVVGKGVKGGGQHEADDYAEVVDADGHSIRGADSIVPRGERL